MPWRLEHTYATLPAMFHSRVAPTPVRRPRMVVLNTPLAEALGLDAEALADDGGAAIFAGNVLPEGASPLAQAYAGHQFGHFTRLGDGRAILLGEQRAPDGRRWDIQLKGAGRTPYSRRGDGRAALGPMLREFIVSEAMHALGIPTTRSLAVVATGEPVYRERTLPGAVLTRVAASHIRVGTFEWAAAHRDAAALAALAAYTRARHYPHLTAAAAEAETATAASAGEPHADEAGRGDAALALLDAVVERQAGLIARWQLVGFIHGVMNTDNMALSGETIDYGPCAFMDVYDPAAVFSSIDEMGRYAFANQPPIAQWNLARLAEAMLPLLAPAAEAAVERATASIRRFDALHEREWQQGMRGKLGLFTAEPGDGELASRLLAWMSQAGADFTNTFRDLSAPAAGADRAAADPAFAAWRQQWQARLARQPNRRAEVQALMRASNPAVIPRNHRVEEALTAATEAGDLAPMARLLAALANPYDHDADNQAYTGPPPSGGPRYRTFCGT